MILTSKGRYAVMAVVDIAINGEEGKPITLADISTRQEITIAYLEQIFSKLKAGGIVKSVRGPGGGYMLADKAENINVADVIRAVKEPMKITRCKDSDEKNGCMSKSAKCITHDLWSELEDNIFGFLQKTSIKDVCEHNFAKIELLRA